MDDDSWRRGGPGIEDGKGQVTLICTILNESSSLEEFLESVENQRRAPEQFIVVDGGSTDDSVAILERWSATATTNVRVVSAPGAGISEGRNIAIRQSGTEWIACTDAGTRMDPDWLASLSNRVTSEIDVVGGFFEPVGSSRFERILAFAVTPVIGEIVPTSFLPSSRSLLVRRSSWEVVGGYPEWLDYCEDLVFDLSLKEAGATFDFAPDAIVTWSARPSWRAYAKQYFRYARGDGKANLWLKRHLLRYGAYGGSVAALAVTGFSPVAAIVIVLGAVGYMSKPFRRVHYRRSNLSRADALWAVVLVPAIVVVGDVSKMIGYPVGVVWRLKRHQSWRRG